LVGLPKAAVKIVPVMILNFITEVLSQFTMMELIKTVYQIAKLENTVELYPIMTKEPIVESFTIKVKENLMVLGFAKAEVIKMLDFINLVELATVVLVELATIVKVETKVVTLNYYFLQKDLE
jgi:hypothetical protein